MSLSGASSRNTSKANHPRTDLSVASTGAIYHNGWKASFGYRPDFIDLFQSFSPPQTAENKAGKEVWELHQVDEDPKELKDLAKSNPDKLKELQAIMPPRPAAPNGCKQSGPPRGGGPDRTNPPVEFFPMPSTARSIAGPKLVDMLRPSL
jgi:arylsulfatase